MNYITSDELIGKASNKYEAVVIAALRARQLNMLQKKQFELAQEEAPAEEDEEISEEAEEREPEGEVREKVTVVAIKELLGQNIVFKIED